MLRDRLKEMDFRITELADYLQLSRPTVYKFIDYYDKSQFDLIDEKALKLFNYINEHELAGKKNVINYILTNISGLKGEKEEPDIIKTLRNYVVSNPDSKKSRVIASIATEEKLDNLIYYLADILPLVGKKKLTADEKKKLQPYEELISKINKEDR